MLVLTRKLGEKILIGDDIVITVLDVRGDSIRLGVDAPRGVRIQRDEVVRAVAEANVAASHIDESAEERIKASLGAIPSTSGPAAAAAGVVTAALAVPAPVDPATPAVRPRPRPSASTQPSARIQTSAPVQTSVPVQTSIA